MATEQKTQPQASAAVATEGRDTLTITDNRTGRSYEVEVTDGTVRAMDLRQIKVSEDDFGLMSYDPAFTNTASCRSAITYIDGEAGILQHRGYSIEQLCEHSSYLEVAYLLVFGELPTKAQLERWVFDVTHHTYVHENVKVFVDGFRYDAHPMGMLLATVGALSTFYPEAKEIDDPEERYLATIRLIAKMPTLAAFAHRHSLGFQYVYPDNELSYAGNFLSMLFKMNERVYEPDPRLERALDVLFILHADHEQNCSTSAVRGVGSSNADPYSAVAAGVAALYGPLHGGANEAVLRMLRRIETVENIPDYLERVKNREERLMGFGHRVYKNLDPRAEIIKRYVDDVIEATAENPLVELVGELDGGEPAGRARQRAAQARPRRRVLHLAQALPQRRLLLGPDLRGAADPERDVHGDLRDSPNLGLDRPVAGDERRPREEDRPAAPDLHRRAGPRLRPDRRARGAGEDHRPAGETAEAPPARRLELAAFRLTVRNGPRVQRRSFDSLDEVLDALRREAEAARAEGDLPRISALRSFEPAQRVHARLEISAGGALRRRDAGLDVMGDGSLVPYRGGVVRRRLVPAEGETAYEALRRALER